MIALPYGSSNINLDLKNYHFKKLLPQIPRIQQNPKELIANSLKNPLEHRKSVDFKSKTIGIAINDPTRPVPHQAMLPLLIKFLVSNGANKENITFYIANGTHLSVPESRIQGYLPEEIWKYFHVENHDCDDSSNLKFIKNTVAGTPVYINKHFSSRNVKISTGNIEPHHFMGYSGGVKSAAIGLAGRKTIIKNHAMLTHPNTKMGLYKTNPMRQDIEEIGEIIGVDYALNVIINAYKEVVACFWGDPKAVIEAGVKFNREEIQLGSDKLLNSFDLVIASPGGFPKDINLYQSQKAITHACRFAKKNAPIILVAECREGHGSDGFFRFFKDLSSFQEVIDKFESSEFEIGPHKSYQLALQGIDHEIFLKSDIPSSQVRHTLLIPVCNLEKRISEISQKHDVKKILVLPYATHTIPATNDS